MLDRLCPTANFDAEVIRDRVPIEANGMEGRVGPVMPRVLSLLHRRLMPVHREAGGAAHAALSCVISHVAVKQKCPWHGNGY